jgi:hypothetical protein
MLRTPVGLALTGIVLGGTLYAAFAVVKIALDSIDCACSRIGRLGR